MPEQLTFLGEFWVTTLMKLLNVLTGGNDSAIKTTMGISHPAFALEESGDNKAGSTRNPYSCSQLVTGFNALIILL